MIARLLIASSRPYSLISTGLFLTLCAIIETIRVCSPAGGTAVAASTFGGTGVIVIFAAVVAGGDVLTDSATQLTSPVLMEGDMGIQETG